MLRAPASPTSNNAAAPDPRDATRRPPSRSLVAASRATPRGRDTDDRSYCRGREPLRPPHLARPALSTSRQLAPIRPRAPRARWQRSLVAVLSLTGIALALAPLAGGGRWRRAVSYPWRLPVLRRAGDDAMRHTIWPSDGDLRLSGDRDGRFAGGWGGGGNMGQGLAPQGDAESAGNGSWGWRNWKGVGEGEMGGGLSESRRREALQGQEWGSRGARLRARAAGEQSQRGVGGGGVREQRVEVSRGEQGGEGASTGAAGSSGGGGGQQYGVQAMQREAWWTAHSTCACSLPHTRINFLTAPSLPLSYSPSLHFPPCNSISLPSPSLSHFHPFPSPSLSHFHPSPIPIPLPSPSLSHPHPSPIPIPLPSPSLSHPHLSPIPIPLPSPSLPHPHLSPIPIPPPSPSLSHPHPSPIPIPLPSPSLSHPHPSPIPIPLPSPSLPHPHLSPIPIPHCTPLPNRIRARVPPTAHLSVADLTLPDRRWLLVLPRHGVGNTLRGWVSAVPYAVLSGRTLVRAHAAQHSRVLDALCLAFHCAFPALQGPLSLAATAGQGGRGGSEGEREREAEEVMGAVRALDPMFFLEISDTPHAVAETVPSDYPLLATRAGTFFDAFWERSPPLRACVLAAFHCASLHCVRSKALFSLLGAGPSPALLLAARSVLHGPAGSGGKEVRRAGAGDEGKSGGVGRKGGERAGAGHMAGRQTQKGQTTGGAAPGQPTARHLLGVAGEVARKEGARGVGAALQGEVTGEGAVWFDVAVHVRTRTLAVEKAVKPGSTDTQWQGCTDAGAHPSTSPFLQDCLWRCVLSTIALLAANSTTSTSTSTSSSVHADSQSLYLAGARGGRRVAVFVATDNEELRPAFVERLQRMGGVQVYWSAAAVRHTSKAGADGQAGQGGLHGLADWWLLSRASAVLQVAHASSFAYFAALFANSTLASISTLNDHCDVHYEHIAEPVT
ncbi:unnamed protein product [Closterium sp. Naga37s-1]|nr:unnamed protein product [Closterium sp. Naga37s-1]